MKKTNNKNSAAWEKFSNAMIEVWGAGTHMYDFCMKNADEVVELSNGCIVEIEKPSIKKDFCFGYGMYGCSDEESENIAFDNAEYARTNENYFLEKNLVSFENTIERLKDVVNGGEAFLTKRYNDSKLLREVFFCRSWEIDRYYKEYEPLSAEDAERLIVGYENVKERFTKRLHNYLKRYGLSKINVWTYLRD